MYDPTTARFLSKDPLEDAGGSPDLYLYCANDPVNKTDPSGMLDPGSTAGLYFASFLASALTGGQTGGAGPARPKQAAAGPMLYLEKHFNEEARAGKRSKAALDAGVARGDWQLLSDGTYRFLGRLRQEALAAEPAFRRLDERVRDEREGGNPNATRESVIIADLKYNQSRATLPAYQVGKPHESYSPGLLSGSLAWAAASISKATHHTAKTARPVTSRPSQASEPGPIGRLQRSVVSGLFGVLGIDAFGPSTGTAEGDLHASKLPGSPVQYPAPIGEVKRTADSPAGQVASTLSDFAIFWAQTIMSLGYTEVAPVERSWQPMELAAWQHYPDPAWGNPNNDLRNFAVNIYFSGVSAMVGGIGVLESRVGRP